MRPINLLLSAAFLLAGVHSAPIFKEAELARDEVLRRTELIGDDDQRKAKSTPDLSLQ